MLNYLVEREVEGSGHHLKERTLGIEIFGRSPGYDTGSDPVVRMTATEVRKRIAQYYHEAGHEKEIRIELPAGSYRPEFHMPAERSAELAPPAGDLAAVPEIISRPCGESRSKTIGYAMVACLLIGLLCTAVWIAPEGPNFSLNQFWKQLLASQNPILLCVGTWRHTAEPRDPSLASGSQDNSASSDVIPVSDAVVFARITAFLGGIRQSYRMESANSTTLTDLLQGPVVLIGAFDNPWTLRITNPLRFHFVSDGDQHWIADQKNISKRYVEDQATVPGRDYAIVGRVLNVATGQISVVAAGLGAAGTTAASEFVTTNRDMDYLTKQIPKGSGSKNLEAVISVEVVGDTPGLPRLEAIEVW